MLLKQAVLTYEKASRPPIIAVRQLNHLFKIRDVYDFSLRHDLNNYKVVAIADDDDERQVVIYASRRG